MAYFVFNQTERPDQEFIIQLLDETKIAHARKILSGKETSRVHVVGKLVKRSQAYNPGWSFHLDPATIDFFDVALEECNASMQVVENHLDEACGPFLPDCTWCPWSSRLVREIKT